MKILFIKIIIIIILCGCNNDQKTMKCVDISKSNMDEEYPVISFLANEIDLGTIDKEENEYVSTFFEFDNTGEKPLVINRIDVSCGCIEVDYAKAPIMRGGSSKVKVILDLNRITGYFHKKICVVSNAENNYEELFIKGNVKNE